MEDHDVLRSATGLSQTRTQQPARQFPAASCLSPAFAGGIRRLSVSFFPTIRATLNHIYTVDRFYIDAVKGGTLGLAAFAKEEPFETMAELRRAQAELDEALIAFVDGLEEDGLAATVNIHRGTRIQQDRCDDILSHLFQHQTHHRGQAHAMLSGTTIKPPQLDEFIVGDDAKARKEEMDALGWTETDLMFPARRSRQ